MSGLRVLNARASQSALLLRASEIARGIDAGWQEGVIEPISRGGFQCWGAQGRIGAHKDPDFPKWSYVLCIRADGPATFWTSGYKPVRLRLGSIVEFNCQAARASAGQTNR